MKPFFLFLMLLVPFFSLTGQSQEYLLKEAIQYYDAATNQSDDYINSRCVLDIYYPKDIKGYATIVWFHGGGIKAGQKEIPEELKEKGVAIVGVNYRLHPKVKAPKYIEDAAAAVAWVINNIESYGGDSSLVFLSGHSAGGYLVSMVGLDKSYLGKHEIDANRIAGLIPFSGHTITHFTVRAERNIPGEQPIIDELAPLYHVRADAPPLLLITGDRELEMLGRYEENAYMMRMMKVAGHQETTIYEMDGYGHGMKVPAYPLLLKEVRRITKRKSGK